MPIARCETVSRVLSPQSRIFQPGDYIFSVLTRKREKITKYTVAFWLLSKYESFKSVKYSRCYEFSKSGTLSGLPDNYKNLISNRASSERLHRATTDKKQMQCLSNTALVRERRLDFMTIRVLMCYLNLPDSDPIRSDPKTDIRSVEVLWNFPSRRKFYWLQQYGSAAQQEGTAKRPFIV